MDAREPARGDYAAMEVADRCNGRHSATLTDRGTDGVTDSRPHRLTEGRTEWHVHAGIIWAARDDLA
jgi:hypothetical protein